MLMTEHNLWFYQALIAGTAQSDRGRPAGGVRGRLPPAVSRARLKPRRAGGSRASMSIDTDTVRKIAGLARIAVTPAETQALVPELNNILGWVEQLGEVDTAGIEPLCTR